MSERKPLARVVPWAHDLLAQVLSPGDLALDLTAGNGHDTLFLQRRVGPQGRVVAFDVQERALEKTAARLADSGAAVVRHPGPAALSPVPPGVHLVHASHASLAACLDEPLQAAIANLGYLPGGARHLVTRPETTLAALERSLELLTPGGRLAVGVYVGHPGARQEGDAVEALFRTLPSERWQVLRLEAANRREAPFLLVAEKVCGKTGCDPYK